MTKKEQNAIRRLERAFKACSELGIRFAGMDGNFLFATSDCLKDVVQRNSSDYCEVAIANQCNKDGSGHVNTYGTCQDSGGY